MEGPEAARDLLNDARTVSTSGLGLSIIHCRSVWPSTNSLTT